MSTKGQAKPPVWLSELTLSDRLLVHIAGAQSRFESAIVERLRQWWTEKEIRAELRVLAHEHSIELDAIDRVRWRITMRGRNRARRARDRAQRKAAA